MATLHGKNAVVYLQGSGSAAVVIAESAEFNIDGDVDLEPDPAFGDTWETLLKGLMRFSGTISGNYDTAQAGNAVWQAFVATTSRKMYLYPDRSTTTQYYYGNVYPKLGVGVPIGRATFSLNISGDGQLAINDA